MFNIHTSRIIGLPYGNEIVTTC